MGAVMVVVALAMLGDYDVKFQNTIASDLPSFLVNPTQSLEDTAAARSALDEVRGESAHGIGAAAAAAAVADRGWGAASVCRCSGTAPEFIDNQRWFNTPGDRPLTLRSLRGRVVLVDFWTYSCINCLRTLPYLTAWDKRYRKDGLTIVGVHSPEFPFEKDAGNVEEAIARNGIRYPVAQDNELATWSAYGNQYWPAEYFIDSQGRVRFAHFGEGVLRREGRGDPGAAGRSRARPGGGPIPRQGDRALGRRDDAGDLPRRRPGRTLRQPDALARLARLRQPGAPRHLTNSPIAVVGG